MKTLNFVKMVATGNDFVVIKHPSSFVLRHSLSSLAISICRRKTGIGADGLLVIEKAKKADFKMRIFNPDGSEAEMCGNGLRCAALLESRTERCKRQRVRRLKMDTNAGIYEANVTGKDRVKIKMAEPKEITFDVPVKLKNRRLNVYHIDTGVPHCVVFVQGIAEIDVETIGRQIRNNRRFKPRGTNVDFVEFVDDRNIKMRTYERGVEKETLACGTGAVASAIIAHHASRITHHEIYIHTRGGVLKVGFKRRDNKIQDVYLEGEAREVFRGVLAPRENP